MGFFELEFENTIVIFEISSLELSNCKLLSKKEKFLNLGPKMTYFGDFAAYLKNNCHVWSQRPQICLTAKFCAWIQGLNVGPRMPDLGIFEPKFSKNKVCENWKS